MIDALCSSVKLNDADLGNQVLEEIVQTIDMTMILPPITVKFPHAVCEMQRVLDNLKNEGLHDSNTYKLISESLLNRKLQTYGYSTLVMIAESHLSLHTFPEDNFITFDCYSCKEFDHTKIVEVLNKHLIMNEINLNLIKRMIPIKQDK